MIRYDIDRCEPVMNIEDYGEWCKYEEVQSQLRLLAEAVLEAHIEANLCVDCDPDSCPPCNQCCQCPACQLAREIMGVSDAVQVD